MGSRTTILRLTIKTILLSYRCVTRISFFISRLPNVKPDIRLMRVGYPSSKSRLSDSTESGIRLCGVGYPTQRSGLPDFGQTDSRLTRSLPDYYPKAPDNLGIRFPTTFRLRCPVRSPRPHFLPPCFAFHSLTRSGPTTRWKAPISPLRPTAAGRVEGHA